MISGKQQKKNPTTTKSSLKSPRSKKNLDESVKENKNKDAEQNQLKEPKVKSATKQTAKSQKNVTTAMDDDTTELKADLSEVLTEKETKNDKRCSTSGSQLSSIGTQIQQNVYHREQLSPIGAHGIYPPFESDTNKMNEEVNLEEHLRTQPNKKMKVSQLPHQTRSTRSTRSPSTRSAKKDSHMDFTKQQACTNPAVLTPQTHKHVSAMDSHVSRLATQAKNQLLQTTTIKDVINETVQGRSKRQDILTLPHDYNIGEALEAMAERNVLSAPLVIEPDLEDMQNGVTLPQFLGFVDITSILQELIIETPFQYLYPDSTIIGTPLLRENCLQLDKIANDFFAKRLVTLPHCNDGDSLYRGNLNLDLLSLIKDGFFAQKFNTRDTTYQPSSDMKMNMDIDDTVEYDTEDDSKLRLHSIHRIAIFNERGLVTNMISQSDIVSFLLYNVEQLGPLRFRTVTQLNLSSFPVTCVDADLPAFLAYRKMWTSNVSGIAVLDPDTKQLVANLSVSDLRGITPSIFSCLAFPVLEFLQREHDEKLTRERMHTYYYSKVSNAMDEGKTTEDHTPTATSLSNPKTSTPRRQTRRGGRKISASLYPVTCRSNCSFQDVMKKVVNNRVHRIYEVDEKGKVLGVITLTDILYALFKY